MVYFFNPYSVFTVASSLCGDTGGTEARRYIMIKPRSVIPLASRGYFVNHW
ncbi:hypothetical protein H8E77_30060 [bacterium]|nr:hypothetical protein [bacterium]